ncbi:hypothetical protein [Nostoc sp. FACHB-133]|uniref:hypothetical protein n=1 Tax=Nostoc sp. FACHB-133 TaxID=2692835 RepID=UPI001684680B|nr:hypothetical protein [Nostoc sp. FACHB-133]MBD2524721.1 hypothetical protein [Nostoc sp. FACHB-133]
MKFAGFVPNIELTVPVFYEVQMPHHSSMENYDSSLSLLILSAALTDSSSQNRLVLLSLPFLICPAIAF